MSKDESDESLQLGLPIKTTYEWRPSSSPIDLHIWSSSNIFKPNSLKDPELLVVLIPGNPGLVDFYDVFLSKLYENLNSKSISTSIICNGHVGHSLNRLNSEMKYLENFGLFGTQQKALNDVGGYGTLKDQIDYHQDFIGHLGKLIDPKKTKVILIGHSVGAYIATKVLEKHPDVVFHKIGLFPTLSQIGSTFNGRTMAPLFWNITLPILHCLQLILSLVLPKAILMMLLTLFTTTIPTSTRKMFLSSHNLIKASELVLNLNTVAAALIMARWEMKEILDLDEDLIKKHAHQISLYYTQKYADAWVNESEIVKIVELLDASQETLKPASGSKQDPIQNSAHGGIMSGKRWERSTDGIPHAFCLEHNEIMAEKVSMWIETLIKQKTD